MTRASFTALLLGATLLTCGLPAPANADDAKKAAKKAAKDLKKHTKNLGKIQKLIQKEDESASTARNAKIREAAQKRIKDICEEADATRDILEAIGALNNADAAEVLVNFGVFVPNTFCYERVIELLREMRSDETLGWMVKTLQGELGGEQGEKKKKKKKKRKKKKGKGGATPWRAQVLIAEVFSELDDPKVIPPLALQLSNGTVPAVVNQCVRSCADKRDPLLIDGLITLLGRVEQQGGWEYHSVRQTLVDYTGEDFFSQEKWKGWWSTHKDGWDPEKKGEATVAQTRQRKDNERVPEFFGSEIKSNRVLFIVDVSGSMKMTDKPEGSEQTDDEFRRSNPDDPELRKLKRIERARTELINAVSNLTPTQQFNVVAYSSALRYWKKSLVPASDANRKEAVAWCGGLVEGGGTSTDDVLEAAFKDQTIDTIYLLSDGAPMKSFKTSPEERQAHAEELIKKTLYFVQKANRFRKIKIYTFSMEGLGTWHNKWGYRPESLPSEASELAPLQNFMRQLADLTGGECKSI